MTNDNKQPGYTLKKHIVKFLTSGSFPRFCANMPPVACVGTSASVPNLKPWLNV